MLVQTLDKTGKIPREYNIVVDLIVPPVKHGGCMMPIEAKQDIESQTMTTQTIMTPKIKLIPWVGSLTYLHEADYSLQNCLNLNKAIIMECVGH